MNDRVQHYAKQNTFTDTPLVGNDQMAEILKNDCVKN